MLTSTPLIAALLMLALAGPAFGQNEVAVEVSVSTRSAWVGAPVELTIFVKNTRDFEAPKLPMIENGRVVSGPSSFESSSSSFDGRRLVRRFETRLTYSLVADAPGEMIIPAFTVTADGRDFRSRLIRVQVNEVEIGGKLAIEITAVEDTIYLGQPVELALDVFIEPYRDERLGRGLGEGDMWSLVNHRVSTWGAFLEPLEELAARRERPQGELVERRRADGEVAEVFRYRVRNTFYPTQAGPLELEEILVQVEYPLELRRSRGILGGNTMQVTASRPVRARSVPPDVEVLPVPLAGRPPWYSGAVGTFDFVVTAAPLEVAVGDPITLTMDVIPAGARGTRVELLAPPPLSEVRELEDGFRVPADQPAGTVRTGMKRFTQSIRARRDTINAIPAIPFVSFVPETGEFETVWSDPIPLTVQAGSMIDVGDVVGAAPPVASTTTGLTEISSGLQANYADSALLLSSQAPAVRWWMAVLLAVPPFFFAATAVRVRKQRREAERPDLVRMRKAGRAALKRVSAARSADAPAETIAGAMSAYVADRVHRPAGGMTRAEAVAAVRGAGLADDLCSGLDELLLHCEEAQYAGAAAQTPAALAAEAEGLIRRMERAAWSG